jgi:hypothetical protein
MAADMRAQTARQEARKAVRAAGRAETEAWCLVILTEPTRQWLLYSYFALRLLHFTAYLAARTWRSRVFEDRADLHGEHAARVWVSFLD